MRKICLTLSIVLGLMLVFTGCTRGSSSSSSSSSSSTSSSSSSSSSSKIDITGITFEDDTVTYDGQAHSLEISGELPSGVQVQYTGNSKVNVGTYEVTATFTDTTSNYNVPSPMTATLTINPKVITGITMEGATVTYDGQAHSLEISGTLPEGVTVAYTGNGQTEVGTYEVTATFTDTTGNYTVPSPITVNLVIEEDTPVLSIKTQPTKTEYKVGEYFDPTGLEVEVTVGGKTSVVPNSELMIHSTEALTLTTTQIKVEYRGVEVFVNITVTSASAVDMKTLQEALVQTAYAYYYQQAEIQYDQRVGRRVVGAAPEMATSQYTLYLDCSSFVGAAFENTFGYLPLDVERPQTGVFDDFAKANVGTPVVPYYIETANYTTAEAQKAILDEVRAALQPGDIVNYRHGKTSGTAGHAMLYVGNDTFLHSTGTSFKLADGSDFAIDYGVAIQNPVGTYDGQTSSEKSVGSVQTLSADMVFDAANSGQKRYLFYKTKNDSTWSFSVIRPLASENLVPNAAAYARSANPGLDIEKSAKVPHMSAVASGETITYSIRVSNKSSDAALTDIEVKDIISSSVTYVDGSINNSGVVDGNNISWTIPTIAAKSSVTLTYKVKVNDDAAVGTVIDSSLGTVEGIKTNKIYHVVGGLNGLSMYSLNNKLSASVGESYTDTVSYVKDMYSEYDTTILEGYTSEEEILNDVLDMENYTYRTDTEASKMLHKDLWGGVDIRSKKTNVGVVTNFKQDMFETGDLIVLYNAYNNEGFLIYVYTDSAIYTVKDGKVVEHCTGSDIAPFLVSIYAYRRYAILRPNIDCAKVDASSISGVDSTIGNLSTKGNGALVNTEAVVVGYVADSASISSGGLLLADATTKDLIVVHGLDGTFPDYEYTIGGTIKIGDKVKLNNVVYFEESLSSFVASGSIVEDREMLLYEPDYNSSITYVSEGNDISFEADTVISDQTTWETTLDDISMYEIIKFEASLENKLYVGQSYYPYTNSQAYFHYNGSAASLAATKYDIKVNGTSINSSGAANIGISKFDPLICEDNYFNFTTNNANNRPTRVNYSYGSIYGVVTHITTAYVIVTPINEITLGQGATVTFDVAGGSEVSDGGLLKVGSTITLPEVTKTDATFVGWSDGTDTYSAGSTYTVTGNATLTAQWTTGTTYNVVFNAPDATNVPTLPAQSVGTITLPTDVPTISGQVFVGWNDGSTIYQPGDEYELTGATTFTAVFEVATKVDLTNLSTVEVGKYVSVDAVVLGFTATNSAAAITNQHILLWDPISETKILLQGYEGSYKSYKDSEGNSITEGDKVSVVGVKYAFKESETLPEYYYLEANVSTTITITANGEDVVVDNNVKTIASEADIASQINSVQYYDVFKFVASSENNLFAGRSSKTYANANVYLHYDVEATGAIKTYTANDTYTVGTADVYDSGSGDVGCKFGISRYYDAKTTLIPSGNTAVAKAATYTSGEIYGVVTYVSSAYVIITVVNTTTLAK